MKMYIVGSPEMLHHVSLFCCDIPNFLNLEKITRNIQCLDEIRLFSSLEDATNYARSLRICKASSTWGRSIRQIAPVVHVQISDRLAIHFAEHELDSDVVEFVRYENVYSNQALKDEEGREKLFRAKIEYLVLEEGTFGFKDFKPLAYELPDTNYLLEEFYKKNMVGCVVN